MNWTSLIIGLLVGWIAEWIIDWIYWRRRSEDGSIELQNMRSQSKRLRADLDAANSTVARLKADLAKPNTEVAALQAANAQLQADIAAANSSLRSASANLDTTNASLVSAQAENERLHARLNIGSGTADHYKDQLAQLQAELAAAQASTEQLRAQLSAASSEVAAAVGGSNQFATQLLDKSAVEAGLAQERLAAEGGQLHVQGSGTGHAGDSRDQYKTQLMSVAALNIAGSMSQADDVARLRGELSGANDELARLRAELAAMRSRPARDPLIDINGIGPVIEKRMFEAGIFTFEQLAAESPERLRTIARLQEWQDADPAAWISEARERAAQKSGS